MIYTLGEHTPRIADGAFVAESAVLIGRVRVAAAASIWFQAVLRGDNEPIEIGPESNIQDGSVLHTDPGLPLTIGRGVTIGHRAVLHGCRIEDYSLIGINAVVMNGAVIGREALIGAHSLVPEREVIPERTLAFGSPVRIVRALTDEEVERLHRSAAGYVEKTRRYLSELRTHPG